MEKKQHWIEMIKKEGPESLKLGNDRIQQGGKKGRKKRADKDKKTQKRYIISTRKKD